jgi:predicted nuclease with TOPRIM domain
VEGDRKRVELQREVDCLRRELGARDATAAALRQDLEEQRGAAAAGAEVRQRLEREVRDLKAALEGAESNADARESQVRRA